MAATASLGAVPQRGLPLYSWPEYGIPLALPYVAANACLALSIATTTALTMTDAEGAGLTLTDAAVAVLTLTEEAC